MLKLNSAFIFISLNLMFIWPCLALNSQNLVNPYKTYFLNKKNNCSDFDKKYYVHKNNKLFLKSWKKCGKKSWGSSNRATRCMVKKMPGISKNCAQCFGNVVGCAKSNCFWSCLFGSQEKCQACSIQNCFNDLYQCTGLNHSTVP